MRAKPKRYFADPSLAANLLQVNAERLLQDGQLFGLLFEVKLGENKVPDAFKALNRLRKKIASNPAARNPDPVFCAVIVGAGEFARYDAEADAYVIPITALGA